MANIKIEAIDGPGRLPKTGNYWMDKRGDLYFQKAFHVTQSNELHPLRKILQGHPHRSHFLWIYSFFHHLEEAMDVQKSVLEVVPQVPLRRLASKWYGNERYLFQSGEGLQANMGVRANLHAGRWWFGRACMVQKAPGSDFAQCALGNGSVDGDAAHIDDTGGKAL